MRFLFQLCEYDDRWLASYIESRSPMILCEAWADRLLGGGKKRWKILSIIHKIMISSVSIAAQFTEYLLCYTQYYCKWSPGIRFSAIALEFIFLKMQNCRLRIQVKFILEEIQLRSFLLIYKFYSPIAYHWINLLLFDIYYAQFTFHFKLFHSHVAWKENLRLLHFDKFD